MSKHATLIELIRQYGKDCYEEGWHSGWLDAVTDDQLSTSGERDAKKARRKAEQAINKIHRLIGVE